MGLCVASRGLGWPSHTRRPSLTLWVPLPLQGFCPSEDKCTNQMFSKRTYAKLEIVSARQRCLSLGRRGPA